MPTLSHINLESVEYASDCQRRIRGRESLCAKNRSGVAVWWVKLIEGRIWAGADAEINDLGEELKQSKQLKRVCGEEF